MFFLTHPHANAHPLLSPKELNALQPKESFRLWLTSEVHPRFPLILLQSSLKITYEVRTRSHRHTDVTHTRYYTHLNKCNGSAVLKRMPASAPDSIIHQLMGPVRLFIRTLKTHTVPCVFIMHLLVSSV